MQRALRIVLRRNGLRDFVNHGARHSGWSRGNLSTGRLRRRDADDGFSDSLLARDFDAITPLLNVSAQKFTATVGVGYENDSYFGTTAETPTDRVDNYLFVRPSLTYAFVDWFSASIFLEFRQNTSTQETNGFDNNRAGIDILTRF